VLNFDSFQGDVILQEMSAAAAEPRHSIKKKEKQQLKHEAFIESTLYIPIITPFLILCYRAEI
jgi:hypothetical protein